MSWIKSILGNHGKAAIKGYEKKVAEINTYEEKLKSLSDEALKAKTEEFRDRLSGRDGKNKETLEDILPEAFAVVREASRRTLGQRHYDVQMIGGMIMNDGKIAEMKTGEGKTLVATLPAYLNAIERKGVHIVTVNDYLSRRDAVWMGQIHSFLGLSVSVINHEASFLYDPSHIDEDKMRDEVGSFKVVYDFLRPCSRREAYDADITYGTNNEFGFDYLRDNIERTPQGLRQREFNYAVVDEIDSILIDEARTPLIISMPTADSENLYTTFSVIAKKMQRDVHFEVDEKFKSISLTPDGMDLAERELGVGNIYTEGGIKYVHHLETAIRAKSLFHKDVDYVVKDDQIIIVDESTGRLQPGRRWNEGLHQAIEAKEGVKIQQESRAYASITFQNYFRLYPKLAGMTGTAITSSEEFFKVYGLDTIEVPTHRPVARLDKNDLIFQTEKGKFMAIARKIKELNKKGQPVLVGTVSIEKNQLLSEYLKREGVQHTLLNAKPEFAEKEGEIVAQAGKKGAVTISTNMAGRGVDIKLGGALAGSEESDEIRNVGGLFVIGTERHEARRIDNQLRGRSGRQGDPGETQFFVSLEDNLMRVFATDSLKNMMGKFGIAEDEPIENRLISRALESAQTKIEGFHFDSRKHILEYDDVLNQQRKKVYARRREILMGDMDIVKKVFNDILVSVDAIEPELSQKIRTITEQKIAELGETEFFSSIKGIILQSIDTFWVEHLESMDYMRSSVNLRAYGQRDPLVEYKREGLRLYKDMEIAVNFEILKSVENVIVGINFGQNIPVIELRPDESGNSFMNQNLSGPNNPVITPANVVGGDKVGRNDPCPCGSGKKYKKCHGA